MVNIKDSIEELLRTDPLALVVLGADLDQLDVVEVSIRKGLTQW